MSEIDGIIENIERQLSDDMPLCAAAIEHAVQTNSTAAVVTLLRARELLTELKQRLVGLTTDEE
jgi:hypothetical protein